MNNRKNEISKGIDIDIMYHIIQIIHKYEYEIQEETSIHQRMI